MIAPRPTLENDRARWSGGRALPVLAHSELVSKPVRGSSVTGAWARSRRAFGSVMGYEP
jgi:hypothetical protein